MISFFRRFLGSKIGAFIALGFLAIIAVAFAAGDISNQGGLSILGGTGGNAAKAGGSSLSAADLQARAQRIFEQQRRQQPGMQIGQFVGQNGVEQVFDQMVAGMALTEFADDQGMSISKRMVDAEIAAIPAFQDASGAFSSDQFRSLLAREGISEKALRADIVRDLISKQIAGPAALGVRLTDSQVLPYASLLLEARLGRIAAIPSAAFVPAGAPTEAQIKDFYTRNAQRYTVPEQRRLRYAVIDTSRFAGAAKPTEAEIAAYFTQNKAAYAAKETRSFERLVLPTEAAAKSIAAEVAKGKSLNAAATDAGLAVAALNGQTRQALVVEGSEAVAQAGFAAEKGALIGPLRSALGWQLLRMTAIDSTPAQPLAAVRDTIVATLSAQKEQRLMSDFTGKIEDQVAEGATFDEVAKDNALTVATTPYLLSTGQSVQDQAYKPAADVQPLLRAAFDMSADDDAQLVPVTPDKRYALLDVGETIAAAPPPLAKVRDIIVQQYKLDQGYRKAKAVAEQLRAKVAKGMKLEDALKSVGVALPPVQRAGGRRADILRGDKRPPAELAILFTMAEGSVKALPIPGERGYFLVQLDQIARGDAGKQPDLVNNVRNQLSGVVGGEYAEQFERSIEKDLGVVRNASVVTKVKQGLRRANGVAQ